MKLLVRIVIILAIVSILAYIAFPRIGVVGIVQAKRELSTALMNGIATGIASFKVEFHAYPTGDNPTLVKTLSGNNIEQNRRNIRFISLKPEQLDSSGRVIDTWGTPLKITSDESGFATMRSAGQDKTFGIEDDLVIEQEPDDAPPKEKP